MALNTSNIALRAGFIGLFAGIGAYVGNDMGGVPFMIFVGVAGVAIGHFAAEVWFVGAHRK